MPRYAVLSIGFTLAALVSSVQAGEDDSLIIGPKPTPFDELRRLSSGELPVPAEQLLAPYLETQWNRLIGKDEGSAKLKIKTPPLNEKEQNELSRWFEVHPRLRERLLLALDPEVDDLRAGARVAVTLLRKLPEPSDESFDRLIVAYAAVWDAPAAAMGEATRSPKPMAWEETFVWLVKNVRQLAPFFKEIPWRLQVFVAADGLSKSERDWAQKIFNYHPKLGQVYSDLAYDLKKMKGYESRLDKAQSEFTLPNLYKYGGTCGDQAYFAQEVCRTLGVPAAILSGEGNSGIRHAWVAWVDRDSNGFRLLEHGRYKEDHYYSGALHDPRSGGTITDNDLRQMVSQWSDEDAALRAELFWRVYRDLGKDLKAKPRVNLLKAAIGEIPGHREAWMGMADAVVENRLPRAVATQLWDKLQEQFKEAPEVLYTLATRFAEAFKDDKEQFDFYERASVVFADAGRLDLAAKLRLDQVDFLVAKNKKADAALAAAAGLKQCGGEGELSLSLAQKLVSLLGELKQLSQAIEPLKVGAGKLPVSRCMKINVYWVEMMELLRDVYKETGDEDSALDIQLKVNAQEKNLRGFFKQQP